MLSQSIILGINLIWVVMHFLNVFPFFFSKRQELKFMGRKKKSQPLKFSVSPSLFFFSPHLSSVWVPQKEAK